jgi:hypothetical protein
MGKMKFITFLSVVILTGMTFSSCSSSDDDEKSITLSFAQSKVTSYQPSGTVDVKLTVSDKNFVPELSKFQITSDRMSTVDETLSLTASPTITPQSVIKEANSTQMILRLYIDLNKYTFAGGNLLVYYDKTLVSGTLELSAYSAYSMPAQTAKSTDLDIFFDRGDAFTTLGIPESCYDVDSCTFYVMKKNEEMKEYELASIAEKGGKKGFGLVDVSSLSTNVLYYMMIRIQTCSDEKSPAYTWLCYPFVIKK